MKNLLLATTLLVLLAPAPAVHADDQDDATLKGLNKVEVSVIFTNASELTMTTDSLRDRLVKRLQKAGLDAKPMTNEPTRPQAVVSLVVEAYGKANDITVSNTTLHVYQPVALVRDPSIQTLAVTWSKAGRVGGFESALKDKIDLQIEQLVSAWQAMNPKK